MPTIDNNEKVIVINEESATASETRIKEEPTVDENMFFGTGHFSIHHQPSEDGEIFMGE